MGASKPQSSWALSPFRRCGFRTSPPPTSGPMSSRTTGWPGWDRELLAIELQALVDLEFDVELTGFEMGEIDIILSDSDEAKDETAGPEDDVPDSLPDRIVGRSRRCMGDQSQRARPCCR
jgi:hypothetical protein